jgi:hypothetical protein
MGPLGRLLRAHDSWSLSHGLNGLAFHSQAHGSQDHRSDLIYLFDASPTNYEQSVLVAVAVNSPNGADTDPT